MSGLKIGVHSKKICASLSWILVMIVAVFAGFLNAKGQANAMRNMLFIATFFSIAMNIKNGKVVYCKKIPSYMAMWLIFLPFVLVSYKANTLGSLRIICGILISLAFMMNVEWIGYSKIILGAFAGINVFFTIFFFIMPQLYTFVINAYGTIPAGTSVGKAGYRAGITDHYSQNGIYISIFLILIVSELLACYFTKEKDQKKQGIFFICCCITLFSLLLTGKRGVLVFSVIAVVFTYLISSKRKVTNAIKIAVGILIALGILQIMSEFVPEIGFVFERFQSVGDDGSTAERLAMWGLAINKFAKNPFFGNGFWSFRSFYHENLAQIFHYNDERFQYLNAHNVYLQVLCETGVLGEIIYLSAITLTLRQTIKIVRECEQINAGLKSAALFSLSMQIFYVIYSFTGNCLYDVVFLFYIFALSVTLCLDKNMRSESLL